MNQFLFLLHFRCVLLAYSMSAEKKKKLPLIFWPHSESQDSSNPAHHAFNKTLLLHITASTTVVRYHSTSMLLTSQSLLVLTHGLLQSGGLCAKASIEP